MVTTTSLELESQGGRDGGGIDESLNWTGSGPGPTSDDSVELAEVDSSVLDELLVTLKNC
uniref:Uncharacterized protein n=1 Tax=Cucumis melo TaxID=3656 RepID=A0A9I9EHJ0_CUCME